MTGMPSLRDPWSLAGIRLANRVVLAPLAGIGNWFVRLQARRHGAGLVVSEMVSSFGIHYGNEKTCTEMLRIHPDEHPMAIQLFGQDPDVMRSAAERVGQTGAGASLLRDQDRAVALARAAREGSGLPVTVKLRSGQRPGDTDGMRLAHRLVEEAGVVAITFHPRSAAVHHKGQPDYELAAKLVESLPAPVIVSGGLHDAAAVHEAYERTGAAAVMLARGSLGNPWLFQQVLGDRQDDPAPDEVLDELEWVIDRAAEHLGEERAARYLRKFYPWYLARLHADKATQDAFQRTEALADARALVAGLRPTPAA
jgi:tRNA-dihydrouridine synthase